MQGERIGRYEVLEEIGRGGQSTAYKARDPKIGRIVAVKRIRVGAEMSPQLHKEFQARFLREAQAAGRLTHPNIAVIYDVGEDDTGNPYIAMEYVEGGNLDDLIRRHRALERSRVVHLFTQLCSALHYAHEKGIVHRDIKPGNIMITRQDQVKVVDFGIARVSSSDLTMTGMILGTPAYMSPEQVQGKTVDHRSDIFSLGIVLYESLSGVRPFPGPSPTAIAYRIVHEPHALVTTQVPALPPEWDAILNRALAKDPEQRYADCELMRRDLDAFRSGRHDEALTQTTRSLPFAQATAARDPARANRPRGFRGLVLGGGVALAAAAGVAGFLMIRDTPEPAATDAAETAPQDPATALLASAQAALAADHLVGQEGADALHYVNSALALKPGDTEAARLKVAVRDKALAGADGQAEKASPEEAVAAFERLLGYFPGDKEIQARLQEARSRQTRVRQAGDIQQARRAGERAFQRRHFGDAVRHFQTVARLDPQDAAAAYLLGRSQGETGRLDEAVAQLTRATDLDSTNPTYAIHLALALERAGRLTAALGQLERALRLGGDAEFGVPALRARARNLRLRAELSALTPYTTAVRHDHTLGGCRGTLTVTAASVAFEPTQEKQHALKVPVESLRALDIKGMRLELVSTSGRKATFDVPDPGVLGKICDVIARFR